MNGYLQEECKKNESGTSKHTLKIFMHPVSKRTTDTLFNGDLICLQNEDGYRYSIDSIVLAHFIRVKKKAKILDLGCGCGVIGLILFYRYSQQLSEISGVEIQKELYDLAKINYNKCEIGKSGEVYHGDIRQINHFLQAETYDAVICNPPFYKTGSGRENTNKEARFARHQLNGGIGDFLKAASYALKNRSSATFIYPAEMISDFTLQAVSNRLEIKRIRPVYSYPEAGVATLVMLECVKNGKPGAEIISPLYVYKEKNGPYSEEMAWYYSGNTEFTLNR